MSSYDLTTLADVKRYLDIQGDDSERDALLSALISAASAMAESYTGRKLKARDYSPGAAPEEALLDGNDAQTLALPQYPVVSLDRLEVNDAEIAARASVHGNGYVLDRAAGVITLFGYAFSFGVANVEVTYRAGYETVPADLAQATIEQTAWMFAESTKGQSRLGLMAKEIQGGSIKYQSGALLSRVKDTLNYYKRRVVR